jgi:hypothetical protein
MEEEALPVAANVATKDMGDVTMYSSSGASGDGGGWVGRLINK